MKNQKQICALMKKAEGRFITIAMISSMLKLNAKEAATELAALEDNGFIEKSVVDGYWIVSLRGKLLAHKKLERIFKVETLQQQLIDLQDRAEVVNTSAEYPDRITCIKITSKYPIEQPGTGINIAYSLNRKKITDKVYDNAADQLRKQYSGTFGNYTQYLFYPHKAIYFFLKNRSHVLKLAEYQDSEIKQLEGTILFDIMDSDPVTV